MQNGRRSTEKPAKRRILIVDSHALVRRGLRALIDNEPDLVVCAEAATYRAGFEEIAASDPDLTIADLWLGDGDGLALVRDIRARYPRLPVLVITLHDAPVYARRAFGAGASGYVTKLEWGETLLLAMRRVLAGETYMSPAIKVALDTARHRDLP